MVGDLGDFRGPIFSSRKQNPNLNETRETFGKLLHHLFLLELILHKA